MPPRQPYRSPPPRWLRPDRRRPSRRLPFRQASKPDPQPIEGVHQGDCVAQIGQFLLPKLRPHRVEVAVWNSSFRYQRQALRPSQSSALPRRKERRFRPADDAVDLARCYTALHEIPIVQVYAEGTAVDLRYPKVNKVDQLRFETALRNVAVNATECPITLGRYLRVVEPLFHDVPPPRRASIGRRRYR